MAPPMPTGGSDGRGPVRRAGTGDEVRREVLRDREGTAAHPDIQAIYVATPNYLHKKHVIVAARSHRHVLCEKPLALKTATSSR